ncbi:MAG: CobD/CbiB family protein [Gammaproteobacteria bacterium]|nr:MAG: CobD/CbiB family protein [Gammaproteobacteria bacterium]
MTFFTILISLIIDRIFLFLHEYRQFSWFHAMSDWIRARVGIYKWSGPVAVLCVVAPVVVLVAIIELILDDVFFNFFLLIFNIVVVFLCLGPKDLDAQVTTFVDALDAQDKDAARNAAAELINDDLPEDDASLVQRLIGAILIQGNERIISVLLWFVLLGPVGAVLYRLACELNSQVKNEEGSEFVSMVQRLHDILVWVPSRLSALGYAIMGSFVDAVHNWREKSGDWAADWQASVNALLLAAGSGALQLGLNEDEDNDGIFDNDLAIEQVRACIALVSRTVLMWIAVIALVTLSGWTS